MPSRQELRRELEAKVRAEKQYRAKRHLRRFDPKVESRVVTWRGRARFNESYWDPLDEIDLLREGCRRDFWTFFNYGFGAGINPKGQEWIDYDIHRPLADWFQAHVMEWMAWRSAGIKKQKRLAVIVHRGVGKTTMITQAGQLWLHLLDPEMSTYTGAETTKLAARMIGSIKAVMDGSDPYAMFTQLFGNWCADARTWSAGEVTHAARRNTARKDPSLGTFSPEASIVGSHPDAYFYDDPMSLERLEQDSNWFGTVNHQITAMEPVLQADGLIVWPGTRYGDGDHFGTAFADAGVKTLTGMATDSIGLDENGAWDVYFMSGENPDESPSTPKIWPAGRLKALKATNPVVYATQIKNDPTMAEDNPLTREEIRQCLMASKEVPWAALKYAFCCDTAFFSGKNLAGKDDTVLMVHGYPRDGSGDVYVIEAHGSPSWREEDFKRVLVSKVQQYRRLGRRIIAITDEITMSGKKDAWRSSLSNAFADANEPMPRFIEFSRGGLVGSHQKVRRIEAAASFWKDGHVRLVEGAPGMGKLMEQMTKIGQMRVNKRLKRDWADAHSDAFHPDLYQSMRRAGDKKPYLPNSRSIDMPELDTRSFRDMEDEVARPPLR